MSDYVPIGVTDRQAFYVGHRVWAAYVNKAGNPVQAGGVVWLREDVKRRDGSIDVRVSDYRIDTGHGDVASIALALDGLPCGTPIVAGLALYESPSGSTWRNLVSVEVLDHEPVK